MGHKSGCRHVVDGTEATKVPGHSAQCRTQSTCPIHSAAVGVCTLTFKCLLCIPGQ